MPGAKPGERRGGRQKGTPNKSTAQRDEILAEARARALANLDQAAIAAMSPLDVMLYAMQLEAQTGQWRIAVSIAKEAAPYIHSRKAAAHEGGGEDDNEITIVIRGGLPG